LGGLLAVVLVAELALRVVGPGLPEPMVWYHEIAHAKTEQMEQHEGPLDFVFTGTSQSYHAIDPELIDERLGSRSYNAGIPAGVPPVQARWLFDAVVPNLEVDTVVWALSSVDMNGARPKQMEPVYDSAFATRRGALAELDRWLFDRLALFRHRRTVADPQAWFSQDDPLGAARSVLLSSGKRTPGTPNLSEQERQRVHRDVVGDFEVGGRMTQAIWETVEELRARDIEVVFVWLPEAPRFVDLLPDPGSQQQAKDEALRLADDLGAPIVDVSSGFGNDDFIDFTHLDGDAADRLSLRLSKELGSMLVDSP
jgi:hypothetical protein